MIDSGESQQPRPDPSQRRPGPIAVLITIMVVATAMGVLVAVWPQGAVPLGAAFTAAALLHDLFSGRGET